jgi:hypothetical protein
VLPFFEEHGIVLCRVLTDRGTEYCGNPEHHDYELYLAVEDIDHTRTKTKSPQTNGICERFHRTVLDEFYRVAFRKKIYRTIDELQNDLDGWVTAYNETRPHQGRWCYGKTPMQTFLDALHAELPGGSPATIPNKFSRVLSLSVVQSININLKRQGTRPWEPPVLQYSVAPMGSSVVVFV